MSALKILVIPGSLRTGSLNARLAAAAAYEFAQAGAEVTRISLGDFPLPIYDGDLQNKSGVPKNAINLKRMIGAHHGVLIVTPEYNSSVPPLVKNTIDWVTRVQDPHETRGQVFRERAFAIAAAAESRLGDSVTFYKIGYQLAYAGGLPLVRQLASAGKKVFVDLKLHDIGNTVARGVESVAQLGATFLTVHAYPQTMKAAVEARTGSGLKILAVTVLTSYDDGDLHAAGYRLNVSDLVEARAQQAQVLGVDGLVSSPEEAAALRKIVGHQMNLVTPGIRPAGAATGDQKRIMTPARAIAAGADYLVVGRPITEAADPKAAADAIQAEIKQAST